jgi:ABC-type transporter lipoprotein component MlaA
MFSFNDAVDRTALKPAATAYKNVCRLRADRREQLLRQPVGPVELGQQFLQGKGQDGMNDFTRFAVNSTLGLAGLLDIAPEAGLRKHNEDFGQTLGYWGVPSGPYLMLPLLGPSTVRDTAALPVDIWGDPWTLREPGPVAQQRHRAARGRPARQRAGRVEPAGRRRPRPLRIHPRRLPAAPQSKVFGHRRRRKVRGEKAGSQDRSAR